MIAIMPCAVQPPPGIWKARARRVLQREKKYSAKPADRLREWKRLTGMRVAPQPYPFFKAGAELGRVGSFYAG
jgi:hypothetical protein